MGRINGALYYGLVTALLLTAACRVSAVDTGIIGGVKFPQYNDAGRLDYMLYADKAMPNGAIIDMKKVLVDFISSEAELSRVKDNRNLKLYSLKDAAESSENVESFWKEHAGISRAFCRTPEAVFDRTTGIITGEKKVRFRTEQMDIDGIGFDLDQKSGNLHIRSNVHVVLRQMNENNKESK